MLAKSWFRSALTVGVLAASIGVAGCAHHKKKPDESAYQEAPVEQLYDAGARHLDAHEWSDGITFFKEVERQHPYSEWSRRAILMQAYAHYEANQYDEAVADADRFIQLYPGNSTAAYAYYLKAECYFEQIMDVGRDQGTTLDALSGMREVLRRYPGTEYAIDAKLKVDMINDQLAGKEMAIGRYYLRQGQTTAAIGRFRTVIDKYQTTSHTPEALYRLVEAYLTLGLVDEAKHNAAVLGYNYPGDQWYVDAYNLLTNKGMRPEAPPAPVVHRGMLGIFPAGLVHDKNKTPPPPAAPQPAPAEAAPQAAPAAQPSPVNPAPAAPGAN